MDRRGFLGRLALAPLAAIVGFKDGQKPEGVEGTATMNDGVLELPYGGTINSCSFENVSIKAGGPLSIVGSSFFRNQSGPAITIENGGRVFGERST